jgi:hypothetical protein
LKFSSILSRYKHHPKKTPLAVAIGTGSAIKINAAKRFFENCTVLACPTVESGVRPQPVGAEETATGAKNRAKAALAAHPQADVGVGIENGVMWERDIILESGKKIKIPLETPSDPSIFNSAVNGEEILVDKACIAIIKRKKSPEKGNDECNSEMTKFFWSESLIIPPEAERPFNEGPNGEWSELKDPHAVITHGKKDRETFLFETFAFAEDFVWSENIENISIALDLIAEAEAFSRQGRFHEAVRCYKMAGKKAPEFCNAGVL